jgi:hypothetical protein
MTNSPIGAGPPVRLHVTAPARQAGIQAGFVDFESGASDPARVGWLCETVA